MNAQQRRNQIVTILRRADGPVNATALAKECGVSRQIIVGDVALLRAAGEEISATPRGYLLRRETPELLRTVACFHSADQMAEELYCVVDQGCTVVDVIVEHPLYGQLVGKLELSSRYEVDVFVARCQQEEALPLSALTDGVHLHTIRCPDEDAFRRVRDSLAAHRFLVAP